ncbi:hypothetical protein NSA47_12315 [Irregularibacter muris]|uniref:Spore germination protein N-terminal domain-containing protein n=1 Tax=Irregularibacter muris TaxID=1796619 RepID=A0AAE3L0E0_9FIRM|nr:hypothetical protein [Irregularibacter muris]MCR1899762.1 hypothetical protein [Irregularibacter muris]
MKKYIVIIILVLAMLPLGGCLHQANKEELENFGLIEVMAYDISKQERAKVTVAYPESLPTNEIKTKIYSTEIDLTHEALKKISRKSDKSMHFGQLRVILFSEDFARQGGFEKIIKDIYQDPVISNNVSIAIVKGQAGDYLTDESPERPLITTFLSDLLMAQRTKIFNVNSTLHDIVYHLTNEISDPLLPYVEKRNKEIEITGAAVFKKDRMIDIVAPWEANLINALADQKKLQE